MRTLTLLLFCPFSCWNAFLIVIFSQQPVTIFLSTFCLLWVHSFALTSVLVILAYWPNPALVRYLTWFVRLLGFPKPHLTIKSLLILHSHIKKVGDIFLFIYLLIYSLFTRFELGPPLRMEGNKEKWVWKDFSFLTPNQGQIIFSFSWKCLSNFRFGTTAWKQFWS